MHKKEVILSRPLWTYTVGTTIFFFGFCLLFLFSTTEKNHLNEYLIFLSNLFPDFLTSPEPFLTISFLAEALMNSLRSHHPLRPLKEGLSIYYIYMVDKEIYLSVCPSVFLSWSSSTISTYNCQLES